MKLMQSLSILAILALVLACERKDNPSEGKGPMEQAAEKAASAAKARPGTEGEHHRDEK